MKVGFFISNKNFQSVDCRSVESGNPGIGGTWHVFLLVASQLARRDNGIEVTCFVQVRNEKLPYGPDYIIADNPEMAIQLADYKYFDYIIINSYRFSWDNYDYSVITSKLKIIPWCHNFVPKQSELLDTFHKQSKIARVINVGREQMELYIDHPVFDKMDYIYNCVPILSTDIELTKLRSFEQRRNIVTYVGSLVPFKCFHVLASVWPLILKEVPDAELYVIGSGRVYNENAQLGKYNIAESSYENKFMAYLADKNGNILPSVHFVGNLGVEKNDILARTKVGVPNPTGLTETFCISAVEMQAMGAAVTAMESPGYYDTIINGVIVKNRKELARSIITLLKAKEAPLTFESTCQTIKKLFSIDEVIKDWERLLLGDFQTHIHPVFPLRNSRYHMKWLKSCLRKNLNIKTCYIRNIEYIYFQIDRIKRRVRGY